MSCQPTEVTLQSLVNLHSLQARVRRRIFNSHDSGCSGTARHPMSRWHNTPSGRAAVWSKKKDNITTRANFLSYLRKHPRFVQLSSCRICPLPLLRAQPISFLFLSVLLTMTGPSFWLLMCTWALRIWTTRW